MGDGERKVGVGEDTRRSIPSTHVQLPAQLPLALALDVDPLVKAQPDQVQRPLNRGGGHFEVGESAIIGARAIRRSHSSSAPLGAGFERAPHALLLAVKTSKF